jgi:hypothetical protein
MSDLSFKPRSADTSWSIGVLIYNYFCFVSQFQARGYMNKQNARIEMDSIYVASDDKASTPQVNNNNNKRH